MYLINQSKNKRLYTYMTLYDGGFVVYDRWMILNPVHRDVLMRKIKKVIWKEIYGLNV